MTVESFRGYVAAVVAALSVVGGALGAAWAWYQAPVGGDIPRDLALILAVFTSLITGGTTFLFVQEGASRASHATERSFTAGAVAGATAPEQIASMTPLEEAPAQSGAVGSTPSPGPDVRDDAEAPSTP